MITRKISREQSAAPSSHHRPIPEDGVRPTPVRTVLPSNHTPVAADSTESETSPASPSTQFHPFLVNDDGPSIPRGLPFFRERRSHIINLVDSTEITWIDHYRGSQILSWKDGATSEGAIDMFIIGRLSGAYLDKAPSSLYDPSYRLELSLNDETERALKRIMKSGPLNDTAGCISARNRENAGNAEFKNLDNDCAADAVFGRSFFLFSSSNGDGCDSGCVLDLGAVI